MSIRYTLRLARRAPATTLIIIAVLAVGMGASTAIFSVVNNTLLRPMMLERIDELVRIDDVSVGPGGRGTGSNISPLNVEALRREARTLSAVAVQQARWFVRTGAGEPERLRGAAVSDRWHETLGVRPVLGRGFTDAELRAGERSSVVLIGHDAWQRHFGGSPAALGRSIVLDGVGRTVVGIMPRGFRFPYEAEVWIPLEYQPDNGASHYLLALGRRAATASLTSVNAELDAISERLARAHPATNASWRMRAQPLRENLVRGADSTALALLATVAFLLIIASVNVAALILARMNARRREFLICAALGASRARQVRLVVTEATLLTMAGAVAGLGVARALFPPLGALVPPVMSVELAQNDLVLDVRVFAFTILVMMLTVLLAGLGPALQALPRDLQGALRGDGRSGGSRAGRWTLRGLVVGEVALAVMLLVGASGVIAGFIRSYGGSPGYHADRVLAMRLSLGDAAYPSPDDRVRAAAAIIDEVRAVVGIDNVALSTTNPRLGGWTSLAYRADADASVPGTEVQLVLVSPAWFNTMRVAVEGRDFDPFDRAAAEPVAIVSRSLAATFWSDRPAPGERIRTGTVPMPLTVIGVAADTRWADGPPHALYLPWTQATSPLLTREFHLMLRTRGDPLAGAPAVRDRIRAVAPDVPVFGVAPLTELRGPAYVLGRTGAAISAGFALFGTLIAGIGILGALMYALLATRHEYAVRQALGATPASIARRYLAEVLAVLAAGAIIGAAGGLSLGSLLRHWVPDAVTVSGALYAAIAAGLLLMGGVTALLPTVRAARTDPMLVLRDV